MNTEIRVKDVNEENLDEFINLCIPRDKREDPAFREGKKKKKEWFSVFTEKHGTIAKAAYLNDDLVGMIQWIPHPESKSMEITCIFVPNEQHQRQGVATALLRAFLDEAKKPRDEFNGEPARVIVTWAFEVPGYYPQHHFYRHFGFKPIQPDNPHWLYLPLQDVEPVTLPEEGEYLPQEEDQCKALIFYDSSCPFCIYFSGIIEKYIREVSELVPIKRIDKMLDVAETRKRGNVPFCAVNKKPIQSFFLDKKTFQQEVKEALIDCT